jgi:hypothetical protein
VSDLQSELERALLIGAVYGHFTGVDRKEPEEPVYARSYICLVRQATRDGVRYSASAAPDSDSTDGEADVLYESIAEAVTACEERMRRAALVRRDKIIETANKHRSYATRLDLALAKAEKMP